MPELRLIGRPAAPGLFAGPLALLPAPVERRQGSGRPAEESARLCAAIATAIAELTRLAESAAADGAEILAFQIALLEDESLAEAAGAAIAGGGAADAAWRTTVDAEIAGYDTAEDEHFRARASDLRDMRDRVLAVLAGAEGAELPPMGAILLGEDLTPSRFLAIDWSRGGAIALARGSPSSHVAMLARARGVPMVVGLGVDLGGIAPHRAALVDGGAGTVLLDPNGASLAAVPRREEAATAATTAKLREPAATRDGTAIGVLLNIADLSELSRADPLTCDGIGLVRTEFLFHDSRGLPDEETQYRAYRRIAQWAGTKPVTIRTLDAGGDKPVAGLTLEGETNPFLGLRGIRLSLAHPAIFRVQLRALARAAAEGALEIMLPMVTVPAELAAARDLLAAEIARLEAEGVPCRRPPLGIMVEVPAAAIDIAAFDADFFSIGSNDLAQYVTAAARDSAAVAALNDVANPAVLRLVEGVAAHGASAGRKVSLCGDAGGDPALIPALLRAGLRALSVAPAALARTKAAIAEVSLAPGP